MYHVCIMYACHFKQELNQCNKSIRCEIGTLSSFYSTQSSQLSVDKQGHFELLEIMAKKFTKQLGQKI